LKNKKQNVVVKSSTKAKIGQQHQSLVSLYG